jgi:hypothetical protein
VLIQNGFLVFSGVFPRWQCERSGSGAEAPVSLRSMPDPIERRQAVEKIGQKHMRQKMTLFSITLHSQLSFLH